MGERQAGLGDELLWPGFSRSIRGRFLERGFVESDIGNALPRPSEYKKGDFIYKCAVDGDFHWFTGHEEIYKLDERVYE